MLSTKCDKVVDTASPQISTTVLQENTVKLLIIWFPNRKHSNYDIYGYYTFNYTNCYFYVIIYL